jgi:hypothetical protein
MIRSKIIPYSSPPYAVLPSSCRRVQSMRSLQPSFLVQA